MPSPEVHIVSLDGLNNNGKTTQLRHLKEELMARGVLTVVRRGDGSRKGLGTSESDPPSEWWRVNYPAIINTGFEGQNAGAAAAIASRRLMAELYETKTVELPRSLAAQGSARGVVLADRGPVSRLFVAQRYSPGISLEDALGISEDPRLVEAIPDSIVVLNASKSVLLARNEARFEGGAAKRAFNEHVLTSYYDDFQRILESLPPVLAERTTVVDSYVESNSPIQDVGRTVLSLVTDELQIPDAQ